MNGMLDREHDSRRQELRGSTAIRSAYRGRMSIRIAYQMWPQYNRRLREIVEPMTAEQLAIRPAPDLLPIWAVVGHAVAMRAYWLCDVVGEPGAEATPFWDGSGTIDWADDLDHPRSAPELLKAVDTTFAIIEHCMDRWTPEMLNDEIQRSYAGTVQVHTRASILLRLLTHEAYHCGELSQTLGIAGLPQIDLWRPD
jgi:uncharacterized damage-inducible protein DinB